MYLKIFDKSFYTRKSISILVALLELILYLVLCFIYPYISKKYGYMGFVNEFNLSRFIFTSLLICLLIVIGIFIKRDFIYAVWNIYLVYTIFPFAIGFYSSLCEIQLILIHLIFMAILLLFSYVTFPKVNFYRFNIFNSNNFYLLVIFAIIFTLPFLYYLPYVNPKNILMKDIYETRYVFRNISLTPLNYLSTALVRVVLPVIFIASLIKKKYFIGFLSVVLIIYIFLCGAFRSYFVGLLVAVAFLVGSNRFKPVIFISVLLLSSIFGYLFQDLLILLDAGIRRILFVPVHLEQVYFDNFKNNFLYWSHYSFGSVFRDYPFDRSLSLYVGEVLLKRPGMNANVGMLIEGYFSAGYIGVLIHSLILAFLFSFIDSLNINPKFFGLIVVLIFVSINSFIFTSLLTHGVLIFIVVAFIFLKNTYSDFNLYKNTKLG